MPRKTDVQLAHYLNSARPYPAEPWELTWLNKIRRKTNSINKLACLASIEFIEPGPVRTYALRYVKNWTGLPDSLIAQCRQAVAEGYADLHPFDVEALQPYDNQEEFNSQLTKYRPPREN